MTGLVVIPARYASSRFPGKPLALLRGPDGAKTLLQRSWEAARQIAGDFRVIIATEDPRIIDHAAGFGAEAMLTDAAHRNGSERCAEVARQFPQAEVVVNFQGDAPLIPPGFVAQIVAALLADDEAAMATPVLPAGAEARAHLLADRAAGRVGGTTAVFGRGGRALYFSKEVLPFAPGPDVPIHHHVGLYAFRPAALAAYAAWPEGALERCEGLEQLRFLENGAKVLCVPVASGGRRFWELNLPEDVARIEAILAETEGRARP